ncbi:MAG TPA: hypothetical protein VFY91_18190 [Microbacterium sp.]|nr:hypothetical protein [Microbacterium sp.]
MLNVIHAAEVQFRHDALRRDRELQILARIADRGTEQVLTPRRLAPATQPARARAAWPRPISEHVRAATAPAMAGSALACC